MSDDSVWQHPTDQETYVPEPRHLADNELFGLRDSTAATAAVVADAETEQIELLDDPFADDLNERLASAAPRQLANRATYVLVALVIGVAGFASGAQVQKSYGTAAKSPAGATPSGLPSAIAGFRNGGGANAGAGANGGAGAGGAGRGITGTVKLVDGTTVYVEEADGTVVTVKTSGTTTVLAPGALSDIKAGSTVTVEGQNDNGTVTATNISKTK
jgi:hypothetical protein